MTTVRELIHMLTANEVDLNADIEILGVWGDMIEPTTDVELWIHNGRVRIEAS